MMLMAVGTLLGGIGIFLIGMLHLTEGLKLSAGDKLESYLNRSTRTKRRGFFAGFALTALVQSSSVVTVATIGFVNARLLALGQAVWVVFGSNVGTTMTAWIVALVGFKLKIDLVALPMVGLGALLHILVPSPRGKALGGALLGFGLLFVGLDILQGSLEPFEGHFTLSEQRGFDPRQTLLLLGMGFLLTVVMQSSSAAMAMVLTLVNAQVIPLELGAAAVIGANVGTTSTAVLASIGATANAKRLAWAHVGFNLVAALVALLLLPLVSLVFAKAYEQELMGGNAAFWLALYHSLFNLLGVIVMVPLEPRLTRFLGQRFQRKEQVQLRLRYLDKNVLEMPALALHSVSRELDHLCQLVADSILHPQRESEQQETITRLQELVTEFETYVVRALRQPMTPVNADAFTTLIKSSQSLTNALQWYQLTRKPGARPTDAELQPILKPFEEAFHRFMAAVAVAASREELYQHLDKLLEEVDLAHLELFSQLRQHQLHTQGVHLASQWIAWHRRLAQQMMKVLRRADEIDELLHEDAASESGEPGLVQPEPSV